MSSKRLAILSLLLTLAIIMGYLEAVIPIPIGIPGIKLGLCNLVILVILYRYDYSKALLITVLRVLVVGMLMMNLVMIVYSLSGAIISLTGMHLLKKCKCFSIIGISMFGGILHNTAQVIVAALIIRNVAVFYYLPILLIIGLIAGGVIGSVANVILQRLSKVNEKGLGEK